LTSVYATPTDLADRLSPPYAIPAGYDEDDLLLKASEVIEDHTQGRAEWLWNNDEWQDGGSTADARASVTRATVDQVEFWVEVGPEHDVSGLRGSLVGGRLQVHPVAGTLAPRAERTLRLAGLYWLGTAVG